MRQPARPNASTNPIKSPAVAQVARHDDQGDEAMNGMTTRNASCDIPDKDRDSTNHGATTNPGMTPRIRRMYSEPQVKPNVEVEQGAEPVGKRRSRGEEEVQLHTRDRCREVEERVSAPLQTKMCLGRPQPPSSTQITPRINEGTLEEIGDPDDKVSVPGNLHVDPERLEGETGGHGMNTSNSGSSHSATGIQPIGGMS
ncbi:hypothetical protein OG21DRAFT_1509668 [Imleria badia]|nr:hypothetical protein OG21DRAFT_1509668 [Imleria badia]